MNLFCGYVKHSDLDGEMYLKTGVTADVNGDGVVNIQDLVIVANAFGEAEPDLNGDGVVNIPTDIKPQRG